MRMNVCVYIYIYIEREREIWEVLKGLPLRVEFENAV